MNPEFSWDPEKAHANRQKHGVTFEEAATAFSDPASLTIPDPEHSVGEERYVLLGYSTRERLLVVVHAELVEGVIRLISARRATRHERRQYEET